MKKIAFITSEDDPHLSKDDQLAIKPLLQLGYQVFPLIWDNPLGIHMNSICKLTSRLSTNQYGYVKQEVELFSDELVVTSESHYAVIGKAVQKTYSLKLIKSLVFESKKILSVKATT